MNIGIDLGTTNTLACYVNPAGVITKIEFENGRTENKYLLPSSIAVSPDGNILVGQPALDKKTDYPETVLENTKYYMGQNKTWSVGRTILTAEKTAEYILREVHDELKRQFPAEKNFHAFVTVPARFDSQVPRLATKEALIKAGFDVSDSNSITDEPIAAAIAYSSYMENSDIILVVDIGGGTFDLSLISSKIVGNSANTDRLIPIGWGGELYLGGNTVDKIILSLMCEKIYNETGCNLSSEPSDMRYSKQQSIASVALRSYIEPLKKQLYSGEDEAEIYIEELLPDYDFDFTISIKEYEEAMQGITGKMKRGVANSGVKENQQR